MSGVFEIWERPLDLKVALDAVRADEVGGVSVFLGTVRNHAEGQPVTLLEYQAYESMAVKQMSKIATSIMKEIPGTRLSALHRVGALNVGEVAVICVGAAAHRDEAFRACRLLIDRIKHEVPVWKREHGPDGPYWIGWRDARCHHEHAS